MVVARCVLTLYVTFCIASISINNRVWKYPEDFYLELVRHLLVAGMDNSYIYAKILRLVSMNNRRPGSGVEHMKGESL